MKSIQEIFKIGKGPSSSHTIGPERAATLLKGEQPDADACRVILYEPLSKAGKGHGAVCGCRAAGHGCVRSGQLPRGYAAHFL